MKCKKICLFFSFILVISGCQSQANQWHKLDFEIDGIDANGIKNGVGVDFEFCLAQDAELKAKVEQAYTGLTFQRAPGRSGCHDEQWLVIGNTLQPDFRAQLANLLSLEEISQVKQTFWE